MRRALLGVLFLAGCALPTAPDPPELTHPNEILLDELVQCNAEYHGLGPLQVRFFEVARPATLPDGQLGLVAGAGWPGATWVEFWHEWVLDPRRIRSDLAEVAAHEVCHVSGIWDEAAIPACRDAALLVCN